MNEYDYCKLYVDSDLSFDELKSFIANFVNSPVQGRTIEGRSLIIDCFANKANDSAFGEFLSWPYYLEIDLSDGVADTEFVREVQNLIDALKFASMLVVPSCDFEDELSYGDTLLNP